MTTTPPSSTLFPYTTLFRSGGGGAVPGGGADHRLDRQTVLAGEGKIALVVGRHGHHGAFAVAHEYIVGDPHRQLLAGERVLDEQTGRATLLLLGGNVRFGYAAALAFLDEGLQLGIALGGLSGQRVFRRHG